MAHWFWKCPECEAPAADHGLGDCASAESPETGCAGLQCECPHEDKTSVHGTVSNPCLDAKCEHCGWSGPFPPNFEELREQEKMFEGAGPVVNLLGEDDDSPGRCPSCKTENYRIVSEVEEEKGTWVYTKRCMCGEEWQTVETITAIHYAPLQHDPKAQ